MNKPPPDIPLARPEYEEFIYTIREHYPEIQTSTLVAIKVKTGFIQLSRRSDVMNGVPQESRYG
jgi:hypothetical protein